MKIAIVTNNRPHIGGIYNYINNIAEGMRQLGHQVDIITPFGTSERFKVMKGGSIKKVDSFLKNRDFFTFLAISATQFLVFFQTLWACLKKRYDFLYVINVTAGNALRPLEKVLKLKIVLNPINTLYGELLCQDKIKEGSWVADWILAEEKSGYNKAKCLMAVSEHLAEYFANFIPSHPRLPIVPCPYDEIKFYPDQQAGKKMRDKLNLVNNFIILFIARMVIEKGPFDALDAFKKLMNDVPEARLIFVGPGPLTQEIINKIKQDNLEERVKFLGLLPDEDLGAIYNAADVVIMPSFAHKKHRKEGQGTVPMEAMGCGTPIIAYACGGLVDTIQNERNGLLVKERDVEGLAQAILRIKNDSELREKIIQQALIDVKERYGLKVIAQQIIDVYQKGF